MKEKQSENMREVRAARESRKRSEAGRVNGQSSASERDIRIMGEQQDAKKKRKKRKTHSRARRVIIFALELIALCILFVGFFAVSKWNLIQHVDVETKTDIYGNVIKQNSSDEMDPEYVEKISEGYMNFVVFGCDSTTNGINGRGTSLVSGTNTDVIMIISINKDTGDMKMVSVYRDTIFYMPDDGSYNKVNQAVAKWDVNSAVACLNQNLDLTLTDYVSVNWKAVALAINLLGGIEVDVPESMMSYINGYITETVQGTGIGSVQLTHSGVQTLDGVQAVAYCRVRYIDNDYNRTARQRAVVEKMVEKAKTADLATLMGIADAVFKETATSFELNEVLEMCGLIYKLNITDTKGYPFYQLSQEYNANVPVQGGWPCFARGYCYNVKLLHEYLYGDVDYELTPTAYEINVNLENASGLSAPSEAETTPMYTEDTAAE